MGYYNPIHIYGVDQFLSDALEAGVDGLIVVDLPPEEDEELCLPALNKGLNFIRLATPTTDDKRLPQVLANTSGFVYYVSMTGITGSALSNPTNISAAVERLNKHTDLPICVGFGIKTADDAKRIGANADGVVVGSVWSLPWRMAWPPMNSRARLLRVYTRLYAIWPKGHAVHVRQKLAILPQNDYNRFRLARLKHDSPIIE